MAPCPTISVWAHQAYAAQLLTISGESGRTTQAVGVMTGTFAGLARGGLTVAMNAFKGLLDAMGGPWGVAIAAG